MNEQKIITVTSPLLPNLEEYNTLLQDIWNRKWITNNGHYHQQLEKALAEYLGVEYISLFTNGTLPLITDFDPYKVLPSAQKANLPIANKIADQVICLPMHHALMDEEVERVLGCIIMKCN